MIIILISTSTNELDVLKAKELGASFYIFKPYDFDKLRKLMFNILKLTFGKFSYFQKICKLLKSNSYGSCDNGCSVIFVHAN